MEGLGLGWRGRGRGRGSKWMVPRGNRDVCCAAYDNNGVYTRYYE